jgi:DNA (cytosine-5)-methyltransferase 1
MNSNCLRKPLLYDVFCGAGGCTKGYQKAGFYVIGVDINLQPNYCGDEFIKMDAFVFLRKLLNGEYQIPSVIHCSPPCQGYTRLKALTGKDYPLLIPLTREVLHHIGKPYVIENVYDARRELVNPIMLCGTMFNLRTQRHRVFESNPVIWFPPGPCQHTFKTAKRGEYDRGQNGNITVAGNNFDLSFAKKAMGIDWMTKKELSQAIPPAYTHWLGTKIIEQIK